MTCKNFCVCPPERAGSLDSRFRQWLQNPHKILAPFITEGMSVMDMGCGPGFFTLEMAHLVGDSGHVTAVDLQQGMLERLNFKLTSSPVKDRIQLHQCEKDKIGLDQTFDFILLFYIVHEVPDKAAFFKEIETLLKPGGSALMVEPPIHVSKKNFRRFIDAARQHGLVDIPGPKVFLSKSVLLKKA